MMRRGPLVLVLGLALTAVLGAGCKKKGFGISRVEPNHGPYTGEQEVRIIGSGFDSNAGVTVSFAGRAAGVAEIKNSETISVVLPMGQPGKVDVTVAFDDGRTRTLPGAFEYTDPMEGGGNWGTYGEKDKKPPGGSPAPSASPK